MNTLNPTRKIAWAAGGFVLALALALRLVFFIVSVRHVPPTSDESITMLQAQWIRHGQLQLSMTGQPYVFPVEAYLIAPVVNLLPPNAFGARAIACLVLGLLDVLCGLLIIRKLWTWRAGWPAALLILCPSAYLLMHQAAFALPAYHVTLLFAGLCILLALHSRGDGSMGIAGLLAGLAFSCHQSFLPVIVAVTAFAVFQPDWQRAWRLTVWFAAGLALGLIPYAMLQKSAGGAAQAATATLPLAKGLLRIWTPTLRYTLAGTMGWTPSLFPDDQMFSVLPAWGIRLALVAGLGVLIAATAARAVGFIARSVRMRGLSIEAHDLFVIIAGLTVLLFAVSARADAHSTRYLLPVAWCFPFMFGCLYAQASRRMRLPLGALALALVVVNVATSIALIGRWRAPGFATEVAHVPDLTPVLRFLDSRGIRDGVASHGTAYRIDFLSGGAVTCSQPINERFPGWPIPFKDAVDRATNVAYVLTDRVRFLKPEIFARHLQTMRVTCRREVLGDYAVYYDFQPPPDAAPYRPLPRETLTLTASDNAAQIGVLNDGLRTNRWTSPRLQTAGMWIDLRFRAPVRVNRLRLYYGGYDQDCAPEMDLAAWSGGRLEKLRTGIASALDKFEFRNNHPVYGEQVQTIYWPPRVADGLRLEISVPNPRRCWSLSEIEVYPAE